MFIPTECQHCKKEFTAKTTKTRFCSHNCARASYKEKKRNTHIAEAIQKITIKPNQKSAITYKELKDKELLTINETCTLLNITHVTLRRWIKSKRIISSRLGKKHLISRIYIDNLIIQSMDV